MGLWGRLQGSAETWSGMELAAERRLSDAFILAVSSERSETAAVYLWGYVVEIVLKTAYFREMGRSRFVDISETRRLAATTYRGAYGRRGNDHDLLYWLFVLERVKFSHGHPIRPEYLGSLRLHIGIVADNWSESLRYHHAQPTPQELNEVYESVEWIWKNRNRLWR